MTFRASCLDPAGEPIAPKRAELSLSYVIASGREQAHVCIPMTIAGNVVSCSWDSSVAAAAPVTWHIRAWNMIDKVAQDGAFVLTAMDANNR